MQALHDMAGAADRPCPPSPALPQVLCALVEPSLRRHCRVCALIMSTCMPVHRALHVIPQTCARQLPGGQVAFNAAAKFGQPVPHLRHVLRAHRT
jgi:hypothetical protein